MSAEATLVNHVAALGPHLHEAMATATASAGPRLSPIPHHKYPHVRPLVIRALLREELDKLVLPLDWTVGGNTHQMAETYLIQPELNAKMRILKERRHTYPGGVPTAGRNPARRAFWESEPLQTIPGLVLPSSAMPPFDPLNLLLCWDFESPDNLDAFKLRVVHTLEPGTYGEAVKCDLTIDIRPGGGIHERRSFPGDDEPEDFFSTIDIRKVENEE